MTTSEVVSDSFSDSLYLTQEGDILVEMLPDNLYALLMALIQQNRASSEWTDMGGFTLDWDAFNEVLSGSGYLPATLAPH